MFTSVRYAKMLLMLSAAVFFFGVGAVPGSAQTANDAAPSVPEQQEEATPSPMEASREKVILDSDMKEGFGDGLAMLLLARSPKIELLGVTIVAGNTWVPDGMAQGLRQLHLAGISLPVAGGMTRPLRPGRQDLIAQERNQFGAGREEWLGAFASPEPTSWKTAYEQRYGGKPKVEPVNQHAVDFIIEQVKKHPGEVTIAAIGPCTNLALAVRKAPEIVPLIRRVVYMGGAFFQPGNVTPAAEFNWWFDPEAAKMAVRTPFKEQIALGLDVCEKVPFAREDYDRLINAITLPAFKTLLQNTVTGKAFEKDRELQTYVWDVLVAAIIIDPSLITQEVTCAIDVNDVYGSTYGEALAYTKLVPKGAQKSRIVLGIDQKRFWDTVLSLL